MPESKLYAELVRLREQVAASPTQRPFPAPILELDNSPEGHYFPSKQCPIKKIKVAKTFEECDQVIECL